MDHNIRHALRYLIGTGDFSSLTLEECEKLRKLLVRHIGQTTPKFRVFDAYISMGCDPPLISVAPSCKKTAGERILHEWQENNIRYITSPLIYQYINNKLIEVTADKTTEDGDIYIIVNGYIAHGIEKVKQQLVDKLKRSLEHSERMAKVALQRRLKEEYGDSDSDSDSGGNPE